MNKYQKIIESGYSFEMSLYFNEGWELFKKGIGGFVGYTVLYLVIISLISFFPLLNAVSNILQYTLAAGYFIYCRNLLSDQQEFNDFFGGFNHFVQILLHGIVLMLFFVPIVLLAISLIIPYELIPDILSGGFDWDYFYEEWLESIQGNIGSIALFAFLILCLIVYIYMSYALTLPLIVDGGLQFWDAMETSRKLIGNQFFSFLVMFIILAVISSAATVISCGLGLFAALPFSYCVLFVAYDHITSAEQDSQTDETGAQ